jgi:hypothetical protein
LTQGVGCLASLEGSANLGDLVAEIIEGLQAALEGLTTIREDLDLTPGAREGSHDDD